MPRSVPELSPFELQCLRLLAHRREATVRELLSDAPAGASYSTVRKIVERLEDKAAIQRVRREGRAWVYRCRIAPGTVVVRQVRRLLDALFDGAAGPLVAQLADIGALSLEDLAEAERRLRQGGARQEP